MRLDQWLVQFQLAPTRSKAQEVIKSGHVSVYKDKLWKKVQKPGQVFEGLEKDSIRIQKNEILKFVSRAGLKLEGALDRLGCAVEGLSILDLGTSTGGFVDCLVERGAKRIVGIEVGENQLHEKLKSESKLVLFEKTNARNFDHKVIQEANSGEAFDLLVSDLSFIPLELVIEHSIALLKPGAKLLCLVKPQFELTPGDLNRKGLVKDVKKLDEVKEKVTSFFASCKLSVIDYFESQIEGTDGNKEFFIYAENRSDPAL